MSLSSMRRYVMRTFPASRPVGRPRKPRLRCEQLEPRCNPTAFAFSTGVPDGRIATVSEPASSQNGNVEFESADDFVLTQETVLRHATFTGLLTGGATPADVSNVVVEIYRVFPKDSDTSRTPNVPTRNNSPSDNAFTTRESANKELNFDTVVLSGSFAASASVSSPAKISVHSGGNGPVTGEEVEFDITFRNHPLDLPADHYFFVPQVELADTAPAGAQFLWLSAPKPIVAPGTPFPPGFTDLQSWMRDDPPLAPDWLRIGTDIIGGTPAPTFNAAFSLSGELAGPQGHKNGGGHETPPVSDPGVPAAFTGSVSTSQAAPVAVNAPPAQAVDLQNVLRKSVSPEQPSLDASARADESTADGPLEFLSVGLS